MMKGKIRKRKPQTPHAIGEIPHSVERNTALDVYILGNFSAPVSRWKRRIPTTA